MKNKKKINVVRSLSLVTRSLARNEQRVVMAAFCVGVLLYLASWISDVWLLWSSSRASSGATAGVVSNLHLWISEHWKEVARNSANFLFSGSAIIAVVLTYLRQSGSQLDDFRVRWFYRQHTIICGMSTRSKVLAASLVQKGNSVVIVDCNERNEEMLEGRVNGASYILGDASNPDVLRNAGLLRATHLVCMTGRDETNVAVLEAARKLIEPMKQDFDAKLAITCHCHVQNLTLRNHLEQLVLTGSRTGGIRYRLFNVDETTAADLLARYAPERYVPLAEQDGGVHVAMFGGGQLACAMAVELAEIGHYWRKDFKSSDQPRVRFSVVSEDAELVLQQLRQNCQAIDLLLDLAAIKIDPADPSAMTRLKDETDAAVSQYFVALNDSLATLALATKVNALVAKEGQKREGCVVAVLPVIGQRIDPKVWNRNESLAVFESYESCSEDVVIGGVRDRLAQVAHERYLVSAQKQGKAMGSRPAMHSWADLSEFLRDSNRKQIAHIAVKLRALGLVVDPAPDSSAEPPRSEIPRISDEKLEQLSEMEHRRWMAFHYIHGWTASSVFNSDTLEHDCLVPYVHLSEGMKEYDRDTIRGMADLCREAGYVIRPTF